MNQHCSDHRLLHDLRLVEIVRRELGYRGAFRDPCFRDVVKLVLIYNLFVWWNADWASGLLLTCIPLAVAFAICSRDYFGMANCARDLRLRILGKEPLTEDDLDWLQAWRDFLGRQADHGPSGLSHLLGIEAMADASNVKACL